MSGILAPINDILTVLNAFPYTNSTGQTNNLYAAVWNNQAEQLNTGENSPFTFPAAFVEVIAPQEYNQLAGGVTESDTTFRIHLLDQDLDSGDGDQNLSIFNLRDAVIKLLTYYQPTACSNLQKTTEEQDYEHTNLYHYIIDFKCSFIDDRGDQRQGLTTANASLDIISGYNPVEILSINYTGSALIVDYRLLYTQDVSFTVTGLPPFDAGTQRYGNQQFNSGTLWLAPGSYKLTATAVASVFTTKPWPFTVT